MNKLSRAFGFFEVHPGQAAARPLQWFARLCVYQKSRCALGWEKAIFPTAFPWSTGRTPTHFGPLEAIVSSPRPPVLFITFACKTMWPVIGAILRLYQGLRSDECRSAIVHILRIKLSYLMEAFVQDQILGVVKTATYAVNFQRGDFAPWTYPAFSGHKCPQTHTQSHQWSVLHSSSVEPCGRAILFW